MFCCHKMKKKKSAIQSQHCSQNFDPGFTSRYSKFQEDLSELNLEAFIEIQNFENENIPHTSTHILFTIIIIIHNLFNKYLSDTHYELGIILEI